MSEETCNLHRSDTNSFYAVDVYKRQVRIRRKTAFGNFVYQSQDTNNLYSSFPCLLYTSLAGFAVGIVEKSQIIDGSHIKPGDVVLGLASSEIGRASCRERV